MNPEDERLVDCVECGHSLADCICNIEDEITQDDVENEFPEEFE